MHSGQTLIDEAPRLMTRFNKQQNLALFAPSFPLFPLRVVILKQIPAILLMLPIHFTIHLENIWTFSYILIMPLSH